MGMVDVVVEVVEVDVVLVLVPFVIAVPLVVVVAVPSRKETSVSGCFGVFLRSRTRIGQRHTC